MCLVSIGWDVSGIVLPLNYQDITRKRRKEIEKFLVFDGKIERRGIRFGILE